MSELTTQNQAEEQGPARTVVVAEDEALIRLDIVEILKDQGFDVVAETDNGKTAVELAQKHRPDLVLMDERCRSWTASPQLRKLRRNKSLPSFC